MRGLFVDTINLELDLVGHLAGIILEVLRAGSEIDLRMILSLVVVVFVVVVVMLAVLVIVAGGDGMVMVCCMACARHMCEAHGEAYGEAWARS